MSGSIDESSFQEAQLLSNQHEQEDRRALVLTGAPGGAGHFADRDNEGERL